MRRSLVVLAAAFAALAVLVAAGSLTRVDQYATTHLMPQLEPAGMSEPTLTSAFKPVGSDHTPGTLAIDAWLYPASVPASFLVVLGCAAALWRKGRRHEALLWPLVWVAGNAIEVLVKHAVSRPALYGIAAHGRFHVFPFDDSFPSGHTLRSALAAAAVASVLPRLAPLAALWAASIAVLLVPAGWHTPSDVAGGLLLAGVLVLALQDAAHAGGERIDVLLRRVPRGHPADDT